MSLIAGLISGQDTPQRQAIEKMLTHMAMQPKAKCSVGSISGGKMGHALVAITPEDAYERQPLSAACGRFLLTADARLDNRAALVKTFGIDSAEAAFRPDSALILRAWLKWGAECPKYLLGDFAFAVWDSREHRLFCARDHMGARPFYYHHSPRLFAFASAAKGLLTLPDVPRELNETALADYLALMDEDKEITFYEGIYRLPPAYTLSLDAQGRIQVNCFWKPDSERVVSFKSDDDCYEAVRESLKRAVERRLRSQHPSSVMLSGGLDSASIAILAARHLSVRGECLTAVGSVLPADFEGPEYDERYYMQCVADQEPNIDLIGISAPGTTPLTGLEKMLCIQDGPFRDLSPYMTLALLSAAKNRGALNLLSGFGGDQLVSSNGRGYLAELASQGRWLKMACEVRASAQVNQHSRWEIVRGQILSPFMPQLIHDTYRTVRRQPLDNWLGRSAINPEFARRIGLVERLKAYRSYKGQPRFRNARLRDYWNITSGNTTRTLEYNAHLGNAYGLSLQTPLLDKELLELCLSIPQDKKVANGWGRLLIRSSLNNLLPPDIQWRQDKQRYTPDFERRITAVQEEILALIDQMEGNELIENYINLAKIRSTFKTRPQYQVSFNVNTGTDAGIVLPLILALWLTL